MNALITPHDVVLRFAQVRRAILAHRMLTALLCGLGVFVGLVLLFATIDFFLELSHAASVLGLCVSVGAGAVTAGVLASRALRLGSTQRSAAEMERRFESIGQRLRTTIDLAGRSGVDKLPLTMALATETNEQCDSVNLESIVPRKNTAICALGAAALLLVAWLPNLFSSSWSTAIARALGIDRPYTILLVKPGDLLVDEGTPIEAVLQLKGRVDRDVTLLSRVADDDQEWSEVELQRSESDSPDEAQFVASLGQIKEPQEYQFVTSAGSTPIHRIDVRYPVRIEAIELTVHRPLYTGLQDRVFEKTDITVLEGSEVVGRIRTQRPLDTVSVDFKPIVGADLDQGSQLPATIVAEKNEDGTQWEFRFTANENVRWTMKGANQSGTPMDPVDGQVRVKPDRPPRIFWNSPGDSLFVHTLAEVPMSVRVEDDYGLTEAAIRFEISGNEGYSLDPFDLADLEEGAAPTPRKVLESILPLEHFPLTEKDYVAYYAYAIDNRPDEPQRVESERRYIDIRQLKLDILLPDEDNDNDNQNREALATLDELIGRQRYLINRTRTLQVMNADELSEKLGLLDRHVERQGDLAGLTRLVAERLQERGNDNLDAMFQAEASMIQAADSLTLADFEAALPQQEDAQRFLVEARTEFERRLGNGGNRRTMSGQRTRNSMLQMVRQRLRRQGGDDQQQNEVRNLVARIRAVAAQQLNIASELGGEMGGQSDPESETASATGPADVQAPSENDPEEGNPEENQPAAEETPDESGDGDEMLETEPDATLAERQTALLDEMTEIQDQISGRTWPSSVVPDRTEAAVTQMDEVTVEMNSESPSVEQVETQSDELAANLLELALNIELVNPPEPANRLSGTRDLTASLAVLEQELADSSTEDSEEEAAEIEERAEAVARRAETLIDVARAAADADDNGSERFADAVAQWLSEQPLLDTAGISKEKAEEVTEADSKGSLVAATKEEREMRSKELQKMAGSLDEMLRQIIEPELEMLRQLEQQGAALAEEMDQQGEAAPEDVMEFAEDLKKGKLDQSAELLKESLASPRDGQETSPLLRSQGTRGAVKFANEQIRDRIRELILREVEADRDGPVPPEYRSAVDDYFRRVINLAQ